jgi:hypothetical protein
MTPAALRESTGLYSFLAGGVYEPRRQEGILRSATQTRMVASNRRLAAKVDQQRHGSSCDSYSPNSEMARKKSACAFFN